MMNSRIIQWVVLSVCMTQLLACGSLFRGFTGETLVSDAQPSLSVTVKMPMLTAGQITPYLYTDYGYQFPVTFIAVYGVNENSPMAISTLSFTPNNWQWDPLSFNMVDSPVTSYESFDGHNFEGSTHIINGAKDPFTILVAPQERLASIYWLVQRYAYRAFFNKAKIILEYREPLPSNLSEITKLSVTNPEIQAFQQRAITAFIVSFNYKGVEKPTAPYLKGINSRMVGNYLGSMSFIEPRMIEH